MANELATTRGKDALTTLFESKEAIIKAALPNNLSVERFVRVGISAFRVNDNLQKAVKANPLSALGAFMQSAQLGLEPNTPLGMAYLIPYNSKDRGMEVQFQIGYQGLKDLAERSGKYKIIHTKEIHDGEKFLVEYGIEPDLKHTPNFPRKGEPLYYYAAYVLKDGGKDFVIMSKEDIVAHAKKFSKAYDSNSSPWRTNFDAMARKTVLKLLLKSAPKAIEVAQAISMDSSTKNFVENTETTVDYSIVQDLEMPTHEEMKQANVNEQAAQQTEQLKETIKTQTQPAAGPTDAERAASLERLKAEAAAQNKKPTPPPNKPIEVKATVVTPEKAPASNVVDATMVPGPSHPKAQPDPVVQHKTEMIHNAPLFEAANQPEPTVKTSDPGSATPAQLYSIAEKIEKLGIPVEEADIVADLFGDGYTAYKQLSADQAKRVLDSLEMMGGQMPTVDDSAV